MHYLSEYNAEWPAWFEQIRHNLTPFLVKCLRIEHVGSTSVPGMVAKPIIDIDIVVIGGRTALVRQPVVPVPHEFAGCHR